VWLKTPFIALGGRYGLLAFLLLLLGTGVWMIWRDRKAGGEFQPRILALMVGESVVLALVFGSVAGVLTNLLLHGSTGLMIGGVGGLGLSTRLMVSLGAGIYEELLFRVVLISGLLLLSGKVFRWGPVTSALFSVVVAAFIFSASHYIGSLGDTLTLGSFTFRFVAGLLLSGLFVLRGLGITAWTHALYDVFLTVAGVG
ncbi:MAG TPA: CPBP family glutamic-type intramembrane protease, partial [Gemmatimonadales bacterium]